jgi:hypothetical protein
MTSLDLQRRLSEARGLDGPATEWSFRTCLFSPQGWGLIDLPMRASNEGESATARCASKEGQQAPSPPLFRLQEDDRVSYPTLPSHTVDGVGEGTVTVRKVPRGGQVVGPERLRRFYPGV